jgi:hypothetical protein
VEFEVVVQFLEQNDLTTSVDWTLDVLGVFGRASGLRNHVFVHDKRRVPFGVECFYVLWGPC